MGAGAHTDWGLMTLLATVGENGPKAAARPPSLIYLHPCAGLAMPHFPASWSMPMPLPMLIPSYGMARRRQCLERTGRTYLLTPIDTKSLGRSRSTGVALIPHPQTRTSVRVQYSTVHPNGRAPVVIFAFGCRRYNNRKVLLVPRDHPSIQLSGDYLCCSGWVILLRDRRIG